MKKNNITIYILFLFVCSFAINLFLFDYSSKLEDQVAERDTLIQTVRDHTILHDSIYITEHTRDIYRIGDKEISFDDLIDMVRKLQEEKNLYRDSCNYYKKFYQLSQNNHIEGFKEEHRGDTIIYSYKTTPKHNMVKVDSTINSLSTTKAIFNRVCQRYDINIVNIKEQNGTLYFDIQAQKLDSALMLLPYYRHKLKYDSKKKVWKIR